MAAEPLVWVTDTRMDPPVSYPLNRDVAERFPDVYRVDAKHPVRDRSGRPLTPITHTPKGSPAQKSPAPTPQAPVADKPKEG